jgi:hypothetical protein
MDYSSMVESLDKMLKDAATAQSGLQASGAGCHRWIRCHSSATSPIVEGAPVLIHAIKARSNLNDAPHSLSRN